MPTPMWMTNPPAAETLPIPQRPVDPEILRALLRAIRTNASIEIEYHSMNRDSPAQKWRRVTPHAFGFDGFRWHTRAWCHRSNRFKDFLLSRCCAARDPGPAGTPSGEDTLWKSFLDVTLVPNPALTASQRRAVELDYGMRRGSVSVVVRLALLYYFDKYVSPGLTNEVVSNEQARRQPLVVKNAAAYCDALKRVGGIRPNSQQS